MLSPLRNRFGIPGVISVIALVFAMLGGAYAASNSSNAGKATASAKAKRGPRGPKGATGPAGPAGPQGPAGTNGKDGTNGSNGTNGAPGTAGKSVTTTPVAVGDSACNGLGGTEVGVEGSTHVEEVCNGEEGAQGPEGNPWTNGGTLPEGSTETGAWAWTSSVEIGDTFAPISFTIPLAAPLAETAVHFSTETNFADFDEAGPGTVGCKGTAEDPTAPKENLCVYDTNLLNATFDGIGKPSGFSPTTTDKGADTVGAIIALKPGSSFFNLAYGTWAVTG